MFVEKEQIISDNDKQNQIVSKHYLNCLECKYAGTCEFMAITISEGYKPSRRTDIQELIYTLLFLINNGLPWSAIRGKNHVDRCQKMCDIKKSIELNLLFKDAPIELLYIYKNA